jgi:hypothetical protein
MDHDLLSRFSYHNADAEAVAQMEFIRRKVRELADAIDIHCPESREKATAFTQLSFVMMSANSAIVQRCAIKEYIEEVSLK